MNSIKQELQRLEQEELAEKARKTLPKKRQAELLQYVFLLTRKHVLDAIGEKCTIRSLSSKCKPATPEERALFNELKKEIHAVYMIELKKQARTGKKISGAVSRGGTARAKNYEGKYLQILEELKPYHANNPSVSFTQALKKLAKKYGVSFSAAKRHLKKANLEWW